MVKASNTDTCECMTGYTGPSICIGNVGSTCAANAECLTNGYCGSDKKCACRPTHKGASGANSCTAIVITGTCTASGGECSALSNSYCNIGVTPSVCTCATIFPTGASCTAKVCTVGGSECSSVDANTVCTSLACACKANYGIFSSGTKATCQPGWYLACCIAQIVIKK
ncbi:hypothetical protein DPMN_121828 [Dreissena polymorpha]|uniref:EGF-like domain-containing protein n=1 Tax=Dreissena polymorpha TaxID=45954 RepID=A0A9D4JRE6_DREPO|nr:hypothetical protein DPMN_121828 [Dreissena polymorpha]